MLGRMAGPAPLTPGCLVWPADPVAEIAAAVFGKNVQGCGRE